jgi:arginyl-tRNA synthetase
MKTPLNHLKNIFSAAIKRAFPDLQEDVAVDVTQSTQAQFGHYQCNSAMKLAKALKQNPRQVADQIVKAIVDDQPPTIEKMELAGPGFINITLTSSYLSQFVDTVIRDSHLAIDPPKKKQRIIVEFSSPNTAKELHVGHLRSTIIGDCLARLFEFLGHDVLRLNHIGDWGTQFGMLIAYMKEIAEGVLQGKDKADLPQLMAWYRQSKQKFDADPQFKKNAQLEVIALQSGDPHALKAWEIMCEISRRGYQEIYDLMDVKIKERGESFYNPQLPGVVEDLDKKSLITVSDGAKCIFLEGFINREGNPLPLMVQKSDGAYNYDTTDMAAMRHRVSEEKADRIIIITDSGQTTHFQMIYSASVKAGYLDPQKVRFDHVPFGLVLGNDGKKFRTRAGDTEKLIDLLTEAVDHAQRLISERSPDMPVEEQRQLAIILGVGAVKYSDLASHRTSDYVFSYDRMLRFEGNTAVFLLYSYVRVAGIKRKVNVDVYQVKQTTHVVLEHPSEIALGLHLAQFGEALESVANELLPNRLTDYLYGLAEKFNAFFRDCRVEGSPQQNERLLLCEAVALTMRQGLHILGLKTVEKL